VINCGSGLAREDGGTSSIDVTDKPLSRASPNASQLSNFCGNAIVVAAGEACVRLRSSRNTWVCGLPETPHRL